MRVVSSLINNCVEAGRALAQTNAMVGDLQPLFLFFKHASNQTHGELKLIAKDDKVPNGFYLATDEPLNISVPYVNYYSWVHARSTCLPILMSHLTQ